MSDRYEKPATVGDVFSMRDPTNSQKNTLYIIMGPKCSKDTGPKGVNIKDLDKVLIYYLKSKELYTDVSGSEWDCSLINSNFKDGFWVREFNLFEFIEEVWSETG